MATVTRNSAAFHPIAGRHVITKETALARPIWTGIITGQIAGLITAVAFMLLYALSGINPLYPLQVIGSFVMGESALVGVNFGAVVLGVIIHQFVIALVMGLAYGAIAKAVPITSYTTALLVGLGLGVVSMIGPYVIYPAVMNGAHGVDLWNREIPMAFSWITYLIMGASFVLFPMMAKKLVHDTRRVETVRRESVRL